MVTETPRSSNRESFAEDAPRTNRRQQPREYRIEIERPEDHNRRRQRESRQHAHKSSQGERLLGVPEEPQQECEIPEPEAGHHRRHRSEPWADEGSNNQNNRILGNRSTSQQHDYQSLKRRTEPRMRPSPLGLNTDKELPDLPPRIAGCGPRSAKAQKTLGSPLSPKFPFSRHSFPLIPRPKSTLPPARQRPKTEVFSPRRESRNYLEQWAPPVWKPLLPDYYTGSGSLRTRPSSTSTTWKLNNESNSRVFSFSGPEPLAKPVPLSKRIFRSLYGDEYEEDEGIAVRNEDEMVSYPGGLALFLILLSGAIPYIVVVLDDAVVAIIIPILVGEFEAPADIGWYASGYFLPLTAILPLYGKGYTLWQVKWLYLLAIVLLLVGSILCALAHTSHTFIVGRVVAGTGAAGIFTGAMRIISLAAPRKQQTVLEAVGCIILGACTLSGAILGGVIADSIGWRWSFWINVPIASISAIIFIIFFPRETSSSPLRSLPFWEKMRRVDFLGAALLIGSLVCLGCLLQSLSEALALSNSGIVLGAFSGLLLLLFLLHQRFSRPHISLIPRSIFANRAVWSCCCGLFFLFAGFMNYVFFLAIFFQGVLGQTPEQSAVSMLPYVISLTAGAAITGGAVTKVRYYNPFFIAGGVLFATGAGLILTFDVDVTVWKRVGYEIILGSGVGLLMMGNVAACQTSVDEEHHSIAQGLTFLCSAFGSTISLPISSTILNRTLRTKLKSLNLPQAVAAEILLEPTRVNQNIDSEHLQAALGAIVDSVRTVFMFGLSCAVVCALFFYFVPWSPLMALQDEQAETGQETGHVMETEEQREKEEERHAEIKYLS